MTRGKAGAEYFPRPEGKTYAAEIEKEKCATRKRREGERD